MTKKIDKRTKEYKDSIKSKGLGLKSRKGLGDDIEAVLNSKILKPVTESLKRALWKNEEDCGCDKRKEWLNRKFPRRRPECLEHKEYKFLDLLYKGNKRTLSKDEVSEVYKIYNRVFKSKKKVTSCGSCVKSVLSELNIIYNKYKEDENR